MRVQTISSNLHLQLSRCASKMVNQGKKAFSLIFSSILKGPYLIGFSFLSSPCILSLLIYRHTWSPTWKLCSIQCLSCLALYLAWIFSYFFLHYLVDPLDLFNEPSYLVHIVVSIKCGIFTKDKIQRRPWCETKTGLKRRSLCKRMFCSVVSMLHITQMFIPKLTMFAAISSE